MYTCISKYTASTKLTFFLHSENQIGSEDEDDDDVIYGADQSIAKPTPQR